VQFGDQAAEGEAKPATLLGTGLSVLLDESFEDAFFHLRGIPCPSSATLRRSREPWSARLFSEEVPGRSDIAPPDAGL